MMRVRIKVLTWTHEGKQDFVCGKPDDDFLWDVVHPDVEASDVHAVYIEADVPDPQCIVVQADRVEPVERQEKR